MDRRIALIKVTACFMVIMLHVSGEVFGVWNEKWWAGNFYDSLVRACVPLFFMVAGATLLSKKEPISLFFKKRFLRIIPPLIVWSVFYLWWLSHNGATTGSWIMAILAGPTMFHLWYFYALVGLYALIPLLRKFHQNSSRSEKAWFIGMWFVVASLLPTLQNLFFNLHCEGGISFDRLPITYHLSYFGGYVGYLMLGAFIAEGKQSRSLGWGVFLTATLATLVATYLLSKHFGKPCEFFYVYLSPFVVAAAYGIFSIFMSLRPGAPSRVLSTLADCSLGIYGLHVFMIDPIFRGRGVFATMGNPWIVLPLLSAGIFLSSLFVIYSIRFVKPLRRLF